MNTVGIIIFLTVVGLLLIGIDFFLPGFVLGSFGILLMLLSVIITFNHAGVAWGSVVFILETALGIGAGFAAIHYGPRTAAGKKMILAHDQRDQRASAAHPPELVGQEGVAQSFLRPSGMALLNGKRLDVVAESGLIEAGSAIKVVAVTGTQIIVRKL